MYFIKEKCLLYKILKCHSRATFTHNCWMKTTSIWSVSLSHVSVCFLNSEIVFLSFFPEHGECWPSKYNKEVFSCSFQYRAFFFFSFNAKVLSILDLKHAVHLSRVSNGFSRQSNHIAFWFSVHVSHFPYGSNDFFRPKPASGKELQQTQQHE